MMTIKIQCEHYWKLEPPNGPFSLGQCKKCKEYGAFKNFEFSTGWSTSNPAKEKPDESDDEALEHFLQEKISNIKKPIDPYKESCKLTASPMYTLEFKRNAVTVAKEYQNITKAALEFNVPRRTLRGWINKNDTMDN